jgi:hypothetical protein
MKISLKDGKYIDVKFWSFAFQVFMSQLVMNIVVVLVCFLIFILMD